METLFERVGGDEGIGALVDAFYARVLADPELAPVFAATSIDGLRRMQREYFAAALGGPQAYSGMSLRDAHAKRGINERQFARFAQHLVATLGDRIDEPDEIEAMMSRLTMHAEDVVGGSTIDG